jgi:DNA-binding CsgD family transcriptional regulator
MLGQDDVYLASLERAFTVAREDGDLSQAARCCWWIGHNHLFHGRMALANGWFATGDRLVENAGDCVERGYLLIPAWLGRMGRGDWQAGLEIAVAGEQVGLAFGDDDLVWLARDDQARALLHLGRTDEGLRLVSEALVTVTSGSLSPVVSGIVYCNTIAFCRDALQYGYAREWTGALTRWCDAQPQMVAHNGLCLVHRAEILQLEGDWDRALAEAATAVGEFSEGELNEIATGMAYYRRAEINRLRGRLADADALFGEAAEHGRDPQPGLALLELAQGRIAVAAKMIRRAVTEQTRPLPRAQLLPAYVEIMIAAGDCDAARQAADELAATRDRFEADVLDATAGVARALVLLTESDAAKALISARKAAEFWRGVGAVFERARARLVIAEACRFLDDTESGDRERAAAEAVLDRLSADPSAFRLPGVRDGKLSDRELEVLQRVSDGMGNREIAASLFISEHTVARHLQNIYSKLGVSTRTAAVAEARTLGCL